MSSAPDLRSPVLPASPSWLPCPMPLSLLTAILLAESAWFYLVLASLVAVSNPGIVITPASVLLPYGAATATTIFLGCFVQARPLSTRHPALGTLMAIAFLAIQLLEGLACILLVLWWELYRGEMLLDPSWLGLAMDDARSSTYTLPPMVWLVALGIFLWWRGSQLSREEGNFPALLARFFWGTIILLVLETFSGSEPLGPSVPWLLAVYLLFSLAALAIARMETARAGREGSVDPTWQLRGSALGLLLLAVGFGIALLLLPQLGELAAWARDSIITPLWWLLLDILNWIAHLLGLDKPPAPLPPEPGQGIGQATRGQEPLLSPPEWLREAGRRLFALSWAAIILYALYVWIKSWFWDRLTRPTDSPSRERIPWRFWFHPKGILRWLLWRLTRYWPYLSRWIRLTDNPEERAWTVRQLYERLLAWGASHGSTRERWSTPREYLELLASRWPALTGDFAALTESYIRARYGNVAIDEGELEAARAGWLRIARTGDSRKAGDTI